MKEINGIVYTDSPQNQIEVISVKPLEDLIILVRFNTGEEKLYDAAQLVTKPAFQKLKDETIFKNSIVEDGVLTWDNGNIDIAPETMYVNSYPYNKQDIITA